MTEVYVLSVVDNGIIQDQVARANLKDLFAVAYETIIEAVELEDEDDSGSNIYTEDGYARIMKLCLDGGESVRIWSFGFDGKENLKADIAKQLQSME